MKKQILPPVASKHPKKLVKHKDVRIDNYFWLRDKAKPETMNYLKAENAYFQEQLRPLKKLKSKLYSEMRSRIKEDDSSAPAPRGEWLYFRRFKKGLQYPIEMRKPRGGRGKAQILLDGNVLAKGKKYSMVSGLEISPDQHTLCYGADFDGSERYTIYFRSLALLGGKPTLLKDRLKNSNGSVVFANDNKTVFYVVLDAKLRPYRIYKHHLGESSSQDELVFEEKDAKHFVGLSRSNSGNFIFISSDGKVTSEVWVIDAHNPSLPPRCIEPRREGVDYQVDHQGDYFWILTNYKAINFRVMRVGLAEPGLKNWRDYVPHNAKVLLTGFTFTSGFMALSTRQDGLPQIRIHDLRSHKSHLIRFKDPAYQVGVHIDNFEFDTSLLRISYSSPVQPASVIDYNMFTHKAKVLKTTLVKGHKPQNYVCERVWVKSHDGAKVPLVLTYKKGVKPKGANPAYLYGYGSYGMSIPDSFQSHRDVYRLIDRGFICAVAHVRGGSEMGRQWYENGKYLKKMNTFKDFIACAEFLKVKGYAAADKLAIAGGSAGGMLMGACMNLRPDLFDLVVAHVPFVDVINTMLDKDLPLTQLEFKEWGNPEEKKYYHYIKSYSPYDNVIAQEYPQLFVTCGLNDPRVTYWEPAKWVAKLRELKTDQNTIVFKTNMGAGHFGASGRFEHLEENAEEYAFIIAKFLA